MQWRLGRYLNGLEGKTCTMIFQTRRNLTWRSTCESNRCVLSSGAWFSYSHDFLAKKGSAGVSTIQAYGLFKLALGSHHPKMCDPSILTRTSLGNRYGILTTHFPPFPQKRFQTSRQKQWCRYWQVPMGWGLRQLHPGAMTTGHPFDQLVSKSGPRMEPWIDCGTKTWLWQKPLKLW